MSEWSGYQPADLLMFSPETYYRLFELYNMGLWPAQILPLAAGVSIAVLMVRGPCWRGRVIAALLALVWFFVAWAYFIDRYATINLAASYFALSFVVQAALLAVVGLIRAHITFDGVKSPTGRAGIGLFLFALVFHPLVGPLVGRELSGVELFGLAPDPTVVGTLGVLLAADRIRLGLFIIPVLWCAVTGTTLWIMNSPEALLMPLVGLSTFILAARNRLKRRHKRGFQN